MASPRRKIQERHRITYLLRSIPPDLWIAAKHQAVNDGISLRVLIFNALRAYFELKRL
jgi:hypothetical protein